jgi:hypothetical protein
MIASDYWPGVNTERDAVFAFRYQRPRAAVRRSPPQRFSFPPPQEQGMAVTLVLLWHALRRMSTRASLLVVFLVLLSGCVSPRDVAAYHRRFEGLKSREACAAFAFDLMSRRVITPPASIDTVHAIFGDEASEMTTNNGVCTVTIFLTYAPYGYQAPEPWILRLEHAVSSRRIDSCALFAPGVGK